MLEITGTHNTAKVFIESFGVSTAKYKFFRSNPVVSITGFCNCKMSMISSRTSLVAVAVKALTTGRLGSFSIKSTIFK